MTLDEMLDYCDRVMEVYAPAAEAYAAAVEAMNPHRIVSSDRTDYISPPPKHTYTVRVRYRYAGPGVPRAYPLEEEE